MAGLHWDPDRIGKRFERVEDIIIKLNTGHKKLLISSVLIIMLPSIAYTFFNFEKQGFGPVFFIALIVLCIVTFTLIYLIVNASENCVSKLSLCHMYLDDRAAFFAALSQVSCGSGAIKDFLKFADKATDIISAAKGNEAEATQEVQQSTDKPTNTN